MRQLPRMFFASKPRGVSVAPRVRKLNVLGSIPLKRCNFCSFSGSKSLGYDIRQPCV